MPDALDLMVVCVEAGLGLDAAMRRVTTELAQSCPVICEEFAIANFQLQMGRPRRDVLRDLGIRTGVDDVRSLAAVIIQAEKFGSSIASALRVQSDAMRLRRRQLAEERAAKTSVKIMLPLIFFIFPGVFVVLVGPRHLEDGGDVGESLRVVRAGAAGACCGALLHFEEELPMRKYSDSTDHDASPEKRNPKVRPRTYRIVLGLLFAMPAAEGVSICISQWREVMGINNKVRTPILDCDHERGARSPVSFRNWMGSHFQRRALEPHLRTADRRGRHVPRSGHVEKIEASSAVGRASRRS